MRGRGPLKRVLSLLLPALLLAGCGRADAASQPGGSYESIPMAEGVERMQADTDYILLDVRRADEFEAGHLPGALNLPNEQIGEQEIPLLPDKAQTIYLYCRSGNRSKQAADKLLALGYTGLVEIGGILDYTGELAYGS